MKSKCDILKKINSLPIFIVLILFIGGCLNSVVPALVSNQNYISNAGNVIDLKLNKMVYDNNKIKATKAGDITYFNGGLRGSSNKQGYINIFSDKAVLSLNGYSYKIPVNKFTSEVKFKDYVKNTVGTYYIMRNLSIFAKYFAMAVFVACVMLLIVGILARKRNTIKTVIKPLFLSFSISSVITFIIWYIANLNIILLNSANILITSLLFALIMLNYFRHSIEKYYLGEEEI